MKPHVFASLLVLLVTEVACGGDGSGSTNVVVTPPAAVASVEVSPGASTLRVAETVQLAATLRDAQGNVLGGRAVAWASGDNTVATVTAGGLVTAIAAGSASVTAAAEGRSGSANITVLANPVLRVTIAPATATVAVGQTQGFTPAALDGNGNPVSGATFTFSSSNQQVATVSASGVATAVSAGTTIITATSGTLSASAQLTVTAATANRVTITPPTATVAAGQSVQLTAAVVDAQGNPVAGAPVAFVSGNTSVATVNAAGLVSGVAAGSVTITATGGGASATAAITVTAVQGANRIAVTPASATVAVGQTLQLVAQVLDAQGNVVPGAPVTYASNNAAVASVNTAGVVTGVAVGGATVTVASGSLSAAVPLTVIAPPSGSVVDVNPSQTYQTMTGWEGMQDAGQFRAANAITGCGPAWPNYRQEVLDRIVDELGINRVRLEVRSGTENPVNYLSRVLGGQMTTADWQLTWFQAVNDNGDPFSANPAGFQWDWFDINVERVVVPLRQRLAARGERLYVSLNYVDFTRGGITKVLPHLKQPDEYGELILETFKHLQSKYGFVPDALELVLEPENTIYIAPDLGRALVAVASRLRAAGFNPQFIGPSTTSMTNASIFYDEMMAVPGARGLLHELAYHRYVGVNQGALQAIAQRAQRDGIRTGMLEHTHSGVDDLIEDLTVGNASSWQKFALADCAPVTNLDLREAYYQVNVANPSAPVVNLTNESRLLRQIFYYVRLGAVRLGAISGTTAIKPVAFRNTTGRVVAAMRTTGAQTITVRGLPAGTYGINYSTLTNVNVSAADVTIGTGGTVTATIPAGGVITVFGK